MCGVSRTASACRLTVLTLATTSRTEAATDTASTLFRWLASLSARIDLSQDALSFLARLVAAPCSAASAPLRPLGAA